MKNIVLIDLGSNSTRLSINEVIGTKYKEVKRLKKMTRMAEGMGVLGQKFLQEKAIKQTLKVLKEFKKEYESLPNLTVKCFATAAVRNAKNKKEFLKQVKEIINVDLEILSGDLEAYYDYLGVKQVLDLKDFILCDMGGGSFELVVVKDGVAVNLMSIPYGAVSLTEMFDFSDFPSAKNLFKFQSFIQKIYNEQLWLLEGRYLPLVLLGGASRTVARTEMLRRGSKLNDFHGVKMTARNFLDIYTEWLGLNLEQRKEKLGSERERADIILAGLTPISLLIQQLEIPQLIFSESGVREGMMYKMMKDET